MIRLIQPVQAPEIAGRQTRPSVKFGRFCRRVTHAQNLEGAVDTRIACLFVETDAQPARRK